ncbi:MAG: PhzF family phenazine biosynthesis protein [Caldilineaceae bacterium]
MSDIPIYQVDAFTDRPFAGNPAAVCLLSGPADEGWMQQVAQEMNLSETAFVYAKGNDFDLRWFTPAAEVELCGHATLATAHILWQTQVLSAGAIARFHTRSGLLTAEPRGDLIELNFPALRVETAPIPAAIVDALGVAPIYCGKFGARYLLELADEEAVRRVQPDFAALNALPERGVVITSRGAGEFDFVSRYFAPWVGVNEDPVTGSVHCCLGPFWGQRLGKTALMAYQASARGGVIHVRLLGERVGLGGRAVTVAAGRLVL